MEQELEPVLLYTMGKVGTEALRHAIESAGVKVYKAHNLFPKLVEARIARARLRNHEPVTDIGTLDFIRRVLPPARRVRTITLVRESVGRNMSGFFQSLWKHDIFPPYEGVTPERLVREFFERVNQERPDRWFRHEFSPIIRVQPFRFDYDAARGHGRFQSGKFDVLAARVEVGNERLGELVSEFLETKVVVGDRHLGEDAGYGALYREFKNIIRFPAEFLERLMKSRVMQRFYTEEQRRHVVRYYQREIPTLHPFPETRAGSRA